jgi:DNA excision repair protein ERCC-1
MSIVVNKCQEGNPLLKLINNVPWEFSKGPIPCDYQVGKTAGVLFLSLRYHRLHPNYIYERLSAMSKAYVLRVMLVLIDLKDPEKNLRELTRVSMMLEFTILLAWNPEEVAKYLETMKAFEHKPLDLIRRKVPSTTKDRTAAFYTSIPGITKRDAAALSDAFLNLANLAEGASEGSLKKITGLGPSKVKQLLSFLDCPMYTATTTEFNS